MNCIETKLTETTYYETNFYDFKCRAGLKIVKLWSKTFFFSGILKLYLNAALI